MDFPASVSEVGRLLRNRREPRKTNADNAEHCPYREWRSKVHDTFYFATASATNLRTYSASIALAGSTIVPWVQPYSS